MPDLAFTKEELAQREKDMKDSPCCSPEGAPKYPWGLEFSFQKETLAKLGRRASDFKVGQEIPITGTLRITRISSYETAEGSDDSAGVVLTSVDLPKNEKEAATTLYPNQGQTQESSS
jgi:hypothetical protein